MDKKNVQNQECQKTFVKISCVLYNKWPKGLKEYGMRGDADGWNVWNGRLSKTG